MVGMRHRLGRGSSPGARLAVAVVGSQARGTWSPTQPAHSMVSGTRVAWDIRLPVGERGHRGQNSQKTNLAQLHTCRGQTGDSESQGKLGVAGVRGKGVAVKGSGDFENQAW